MKRHILFILLISSSILLFGQAKGFSKFSILGEFGQNQIDVDGPGNLGNMYGGSLEYGISPTFGISANYYNYQTSGSTNNDVNYKFSTNLQAIDLGLTANITKLILPRSRSKFNLSANIGIGQALYAFDMSLVRQNNWLVKNDSVKSSSAQAITIPIRLYAEYDLTRNFSLGAKFHFNTYVADNLEGSLYGGTPYHGSSNDNIIGATLFVRFKFTGRQKEHVRDINMVDFYPDQSLEIVKEVKLESNSMKGQVDSMLTRIALVENRAVILNSRIDNLDSKIEGVSERTIKIEKLLSNDGLDTDGDGVPDERDKDNTTVKGVAVDFWGKALPIAENKQLGLNVDSILTELARISEQSNMNAIERQNSSANEAIQSKSNLDSIVNELTNRMNNSQRVDTLANSSNINADSVLIALSAKVDEAVLKSVSKYTNQKFDSLSAVIAERENKVKLNRIAKQTNLNVDSILSVLSVRVDQSVQKGLANQPKHRCDSMELYTASASKSSNINVDSLVAVITARVTKSMPTQPKSVAQTTPSSTKATEQVSKVNIDSIVAEVTAKVNKGNVTQGTQPTSNIDYESLLTELTKRVNASGGNTATIANVAAPIGASQTTGTPIEYIPQVYFGYNKVDLDDAALITISKIAHKLTSDPSLKVEVRGFCDKAGNADYNLQLSKRRAERVKTELINSWGIPASRVSANGGGTTGNVPTTYGPNRRCDFFFSK